MRRCLTGDSGAPEAVAPQRISGPAAPGAGRGTAPASSHPRRGAGLRSVQPLPGGPTPLRTPQSLAGGRGYTFEERIGPRFFCVSFSARPASISEPSTHSHRDAALTLQRPGRTLFATSPTATRLPDGAGGQPRVCARFTGPGRTRYPGTPTIVDSRRSQPDTGTDFVRQAETLIRSLAGVTHARIEATPSGIEAIHVVATDDDSAARLAGHVRSALLAGLATPVVAGRIHVRTGTAQARRPGRERAQATGMDTDPVELAPPRDRLRLLHGDDEAPAGAAVEADDALVAPAPRGGAAVVEVAARPHVERARLVSVDVRQPGDGRVVCRVSVAWDGQVHRAEAVAMDLPGAAAQAAAQAAVRALASAGLDGLELSGLREVEIAGKEYVLVALRRHDGAAVRHRSGSALRFGTPERSAAEAAVDAANELI